MLAAGLVGLNVLSEVAHEDDLVKAVAAYVHEQEDVVALEGARVDVDAHTVELRATRADGDVVFVTTPWERSLVPPAAGEARRLVTVRVEDEKPASWGGDD